MKTIGVLWDEEIEWGREKPFESRIDQTYGLFSEVAEENDVKFFNAKYAWYGDGVLEKAYHWNGSAWEKVRDVELDGVFDKFHFDEDTEKLKRKMQEQVGILNVPGLEKLCKDKLLTYRKFPGLIPETRKAEKEEIEQMLEKYGKVVVKPRYAFGGKGIQIIGSLSELEPVGEDYVVQEFFDSSGGIPGIVDTDHDLRAIVINGEVVGAYVRYSEDSRVSNLTQGGQKENVPLEDFPESGLDVVEKVSEELSRFEPAVFSVDLFFGDGEVRIVELNTKPGLSFGDDPELEAMSRRTMERYVEALKQI